MSKFYDWVQDLYDRDIVDCDSLAELSCKNCPNDYIFEPNIQRVLYKLQRVARDLLLKVIKKEIQDVIIETYLYELPFSLNRYIHCSNIMWDAVRYRLLEEELFNDVEIVKEVKGDYTDADCYVVLYHSGFDEYIKVEGYYSSYKGPNYTSFRETKLIKKKQVVYEYD